MRLASAAVAAYAAAVGVLYGVQDRLVFFPTDDPMDACVAMKALGATAHDVSVGETRVRYFRRAVDGAQATLVLFHGNAGWRRAQRPTAPESHVLLG